MGEGLQAQAWQCSQCVKQLRDPDLFLLEKERLEGKKPYSAEQ